MSCANRLLSILVLTILPTSAFAEDPPAAPAPTPAKILNEAFKDIGSIASRRVATILGIGGAAALAVHPADRYINRQVEGSDYRLLTAGRVIGSAKVQLGGAAGVYLAGLFAGRESETARIGAELVRAQLVTQALTYGIKSSVRRDRPDGNGHLAFPSGHASTTFATATVLASRFGWAVATPSYLIASYVASSRLHENRHSASDVVFGAALGIAVGQTVHARKGAAVEIQPVALANGGGVLVQW